MKRVMAKTDGARTLDARENLNGRLALTVSEVAKHLGISSTAVRLMIAKGDLPGRKVGGGIERLTYIVPTAQLLLWLEGKPWAETAEAKAG